MLTFVLGTTLVTLLVVPPIYQTIPNLTSEDVQANTVLRLVDILLQSQSITHNHLDLLRTKIEAAETVLGGVNVAQDQSILVTWNLRAYSAPKKFTFEPCLIFYDNASTFLPSICHPS
jgi:hypothetical protein